MDTTSLHANDELQRLIEETARLARLGFAAAGGGNVSLRTEDGILLSGSGTDLDRLSPDQFCLLPAGESDWLNAKGYKPSKEYPFHLGIYKAVPGARCILHFHPPRLTAATTLVEDGENSLPVMIPYYLIRCRGTLQVPYFHPGTEELAEAVVAAARRAQLILMRNHGATVYAADPAGAAAALETAEENARVLLETGLRGRPLDEEACAELRERYWR